jgi:PAS domain S-box-containing protein
VVRLERTKVQRERQLHDMEVLLRQSEDRWRRIIQDMPIMFDAVDAMGNFTVWNHECERVTGYSSAEIVGNPRAFDLLYPDPAYRETILADWGRTGNHFRDLELDLTCKDGSIRTIAWSNLSDLHPIPGWAAWAVGVDVTARRQAQRELEASEARYRVLAENNSDLICLHQPDGRFTYLSPSVKRLLGFTPEALIGMSPYDLFHPEDAGRIRETSHQLALEGVEIDYIEYRMRTQAGDYIWLETSTQPVINDAVVTGLVTVSRDITLRVEMLNGLRQSEARFRSMFDNAPIGMVLIGVKGEVVLSNPVLNAMLGLTEIDLLTRPFAELCTGRECADLADQMAALSQRQIERFTREVRFICADERSLWVNLTVAHIQIAEGDFVLAVGMIEDITERKAQEAQLQRYIFNLELANLIDHMVINKQSLADIVSSTLLGLSMVLPYMLAYVNKLDHEAGWMRVLGVQSPDMATPPIQDTPIADRTDLIERLKVEQIIYADPELLRARTRNPAVVGQMIAQQMGRMAIVRLMYGGEIVGVLAIARKTTAPLTDSDQQILDTVTSRLAIAIHEDNINAQIARYTNQLETMVEQRTAQLSEVNRDLDEFAYVVSHDLKAPLRGITQLADWLQTDYGSQLDEQARSMLSLMVGRTRRMHQLIEGILEYSRIGRAAERAKPVDLNALLAETLDLLVVPPQFDVRIPPDLPTLYADETRLRQVFQNLLSNAIKFMDKPRGQITIACVDAVDAWRFSISDNGPGIEQAHFERIFKLFQTLRPRDELENTGIGLALVKKIVEQHGGQISVESVVGQGSTFTFTMLKDAVSYENA